MTVLIVRLSLLLLFLYNLIEEQTQNSFETMSCSRKQERAFIQLTFSRLILNIYVSFEGKSSLFIQSKTDFFSSMAQKRARENTKPIF